MPPEIIEILERDLQTFDGNVDASKVLGNQVDTEIRNSENAWIHTSHWITGWLWYYIQKMNRENFQYNITDIDGGSMQYTHYGPGQFYNWHTDGDLDLYYKPEVSAASGVNQGNENVILAGENVRKLSFSLLLSDPKDYTGGEFQFLGANGKSFLAPKQRGTLIIFDSRTKHRVRKVRSGVRKSLVGWVVGPRWK
jgi:PKHD-type hydroxylase